MSESPRWEGGHKHRGRGQSQNRRGACHVAEEAAGHHESREGGGGRGTPPSGTRQRPGPHLCASSRRGCWRSVPGRDRSEAEGRTPGEVGSGFLAQVLRAVPSPQCRQATSGSPRNCSWLCGPARSPASPPDLQQQPLLTLPTGVKAADSVLSPLSLRIQTGACFPERTLTDTPLDLLRGSLFTFERSDYSKAMNRKMRSEGI